MPRETDDSMLHECTILYSVYTIHCIVYTVYG